MSPFLSTATQSHSHSTSPSLRTALHESNQLSRPARHDAHYGLWAGAVQFFVTSLSRVPLEGAPGGQFTIMSSTDQPDEQSMHESVAARQVGHSSMKRRPEVQRLRAKFFPSMMSSPSSADLELV